MRIANAQGLNVICCWYFFSNTFTQTFREHRTRVNPCDVTGMLYVDKILSNFILSFFKAVFLFPYNCCYAAILCSVAGKLAIKKGIKTLCTT